MDLHVADVTFEKSKSKTRHLFARTNYRVTSLLNNSHISVCSPSTHVMFPTRLQALFGPDMTPTPWSYLWTIFFCLVLLCGTCRSSKGSKLVFVSVVSCVVASAMSEGREVGATAGYLLFPD